MTSLLDTGSPTGRLAVTLDFLPRFPRSALGEHDPAEDTSGQTRGGPKPSQPAGAQSRCPHSTAGEPRTTVWAENGLEPSAQEAIWSEDSRQDFRVLGDFYSVLVSLSF